MPFSTLGLLKSRAASLAASTSPAIAQCREAWLSRYKSERTKGQVDVCAALDADASYCEAMPPLLDYESIRDFIACTGHGMLIGVIPRQEGTQFLYAAQVALAAIRHQPQEARQPGRPKKVTE